MALVGVKEVWWRRRKLPRLLRNTETVFEPLLATAQIGLPLPPNRPMATDIWKGRAVVNLLWQQRNLRAILPLLGMRIRKRV